MRAETIFEELQIIPTQQLLRQLRRIKGLRLKDVSKLSGYNAASLSCYERLHQEPTLFSYRAIINSMGFEIRVEDNPIDEKLLVVYRARAGFSVEQMAAILGCSPATVWRFECDMHPIKFTRAMSWLHACGIPVSVVML